MYLIVGSDGLIGSALRQKFTVQGIRHVATSRHPDSSQIPLDLASDPDTWDIPGQVDAAFLCAAHTNLKDCDDSSGQTAFINVERTAEIAQRLLARGAFVVFLSTSYVFDGSKPFQRPSDPCSPKTEYGRQKMRAEQELLSLSKDVAVIRPTKIMHQSMPLLRGWKESLQKGEVIRPFRDFLFCPILLSFVVNALEKIADRKLSGITHLSADRDVSYAELAHSLAEWLGADMNLVQPVSARPEMRGFSTLNMDRAVQELGIHVPSVSDSINFLRREILK